MPAVAAAASGCTRDEASGASSTASAKSGRAASQDAPREWEAFVAWVEQELQKTPDAVPLPASPTLPAAKWPVIALDDRLPSAAVQCQWSPAATSDAPLLAKGPFRVKVSKNQPRPPEGVDGPPTGFSFRLKDLNLRREDVGRIALDIRVPFGDYIELVWSVTHVRIPLPDNQKAWKLSVTTEGFSEWSGPLKGLGIRTQGFGDGVVEIRSVEFYGHASAYPAAVGVRRAAIVREQRPAIYAHGNAEVRFDGIVVPPDGRFHSGVAHIVPARSPGASVQTGDAPVGPPEAAESSAQLCVLVRDGDQSRAILECDVAAGAEWHDVSASLAPWAGRTVSLVLQSSSSHAEGIALWGAPVVYQPVADAPLVVIYLVDTLAAEHMGLYGYPRPTTPTLNALGDRGVWFANMFSNSSRTIESVPDLLVSLPAERHGSYETSVGVPSELVTLAETLRAAGFATASFCTNVNAGPQQNMDQGFDVFYEPTEGWFQDRTIPLEAAERWLDHHADRPGFVYVHTAEPHGPYTPPEGFANSFDPDYRGPIDGSYERGRGFKNASSERDLAHVMALYDEEILYADSRIGKFVESLERRGLTSRTNLFVTADHGEEFQQHGAWEHGMNLHNEQTRIPLVVAGPWVAHRGRIDAAVQLSDVMPTILDVLELPQPYPLAGQSLAALLRGEQAAASSDRRESGVAADQRPPRGAAASGAGARTIYASNFNYKNYGVVEFSLIEDGRWKAMYSFREQTLGDGRTTHLAVYDLASDPRERTNLLLKDRDRSRALFEKLVAHVRSQPPYARKPTDRPIQYDPAQLRELRSLGYIGDE